MWDFNPRAPCGARLVPSGVVSSLRVYFNPRAPCGARPASWITLCVASNFNPRAPCGARPGIYLLRFLSCVFQSTRPMRGATRKSRDNLLTGDISIHAPHAGRDYCAEHQPKPKEHFNPRAPCGARLSCSRPLARPLLFQSTRPMRGATTRGMSAFSTDRHFNPRAPCGARRGQHRT